MTQPQIDQCLSDVRNLQRIADDTAHASQEDNVTGTPTFFINGVQAQGVGLWPQLDRGSGRRWAADARPAPAHRARGGRPAGGPGDAGRGAAQPGAGAAARTPAVTDWTRVAVRTPEGGVRLGNPAARGEAGRIWLDHLPALRRISPSEGTAPLYGHVRTGRVSWEYRPYMSFPTDPALFALLSCQAPGAFFPTVEQLYATQRTWVARVQTWLEANREQVLAMAGPARATALFRASQVDGLFRATWHDPGADQCLHRQCRQSQARLPRARSAPASGTASPARRPSSSTGCVPRMSAAGRTWSLC